MLQEIVNVIDTGALVHLLQSGNLDLHLARGRTTILTNEVWSAS